MLDYGVRATQTLWCRGPARHPFKVEIVGSNPTRVANSPIRCCAAPSTRLSAASNADSISECRCSAPRRSPSLIVVGPQRRETREEPAGPHGADGRHPGGRKQHERLGADSVVSPATVTGLFLRPF